MYCNSDYALCQQRLIKAEVITVKHRIIDIEYNGGCDVYEDPADYIDDINDIYVESWDIEDNWKLCG